MTVHLIEGDCLSVLRALPANLVHCIVTSPPYWGLRDYGTPQQLGLEPTYNLYVDRIVEVFREVRRVLRPDGTCWLNLGDSYATGAGKVGEHPGGGAQGARWANGVGPMTQANRMPQPNLKPKDLVGIPWRVAFALQSDGWYLRQDIIWSKPNPMPESVRDRCTKAHEYLFLLSKSERYFYDADAVLEPYANGVEKAMPWKANGGVRNVGGRTDGFARGTAPDWKAKSGGRNRRSVWTVNTKPFPEAHFATFPPALVEPCILAGCPLGGLVLDPFSGAGTVGLVTTQHNRHALLIEVKREYIDMAARRIRTSLPSAAVEVRAQ